VAKPASGNAGILADKGGRWRAGAEKADALKFDIPFVVRAAPANPSEPQAKTLSGA